jgi:hypothetical protein
MTLLLCQEKPKLFYDFVENQAEFFSPSVAREISACSTVEV